MICPSCEGRELEQDMVDVGVGEIPCSPLGCPDCHWVDGEPVPTRAELHAELSRLRCAGDERNIRQDRVHAWCKRAFGDEHSTNLTQRGLRFLEEAIEAFQAVDGDPAMAHKLVDFVFARPRGGLAQELGGCGTTLLALAAAAGLSADEQEMVEVQRVLSKPEAHFTERNRLKNEAGFVVKGSK